MSTCTNCKRYTRGESPVCYECYTKGEKYVDGFHSFSFEKVPLKYIKGHVGEGIIQNLFSSLGFIVFKYGIENNLTYISEYLTNSDFSSAELNILRSRPDLLVLNKEKKRLYFIEVKYISATGEISKESFVVIEFEDCNGVWITNIKNLYYDGEPNQPDEFTININKEEDKNRLLDALKKAANNTKSEYLIQRAQANR